MPSSRGWRIALLSGLSGKSYGLFRAGPPSLNDAVAISDTNFAGRAGRISRTDFKVEGATFLPSLDEVSFLDVFVVGKLFG